MSKEINVIERISSVIYNELCYMYCDNCRNAELDVEKREEACEFCYRKYNNWGVAKHTADEIAEKIAEELAEEQE